MAQIKIIGRVIENTNENEGIPFVNCKITPNEGTIGFSTDVNGNFNATINLNIYSVYSFNFTSVGYTPDIKEVQIKSTTLNLGTIKLNESNTVLDEFEVIAEETIIDFSIKGTIVDSNKKAISGALIESSKGETTRSQNKGNFNLNGRYNKNNPFTLTISAPKYNTISGITPFTLNNKIINDLGVYSLVLLEKDIEKELNQLSNYNESQLSLLKRQGNKDFFTLLVARLTSVLKSLLWPAILLLLADFGISNVNDLLKKKNVKFNDLKASCPANIEELNKIINKKNKFTKQLSNLLKLIGSLGKLLKLPPKIISGGEKVIKIAGIVLRILPYIPSTSFTPIPTGPFLDAKDLIKALKDLITLLKGKLGNNSFQLNFLIEDLNKAIQMLAILDTVIQGCADEITNNSSNSTLEDQEKISNELLKSTQEQSQQLSPVVTNINGFEMGVVSVDSQIVGGLKRRQAVARNLAGVIMLKGEPSFSSNDQILIDELIYYIETNDLKAD